jgi:hypothetical protein
MDYLSSNNDLDAYLIYSDSSGRLKTRMTEGFRTILAEENQE